MKRLALTVTVVSLSLAGCGRHAGAAEPSRAPIRGKPAAPVTVEARLAPTSAQVTVRFDADGKDVRVAVHGAEGLEITAGAAPVEGASVSSGDARTFDVAFTPGPGRSFLVVAVSGKFKGTGKRASVASFAVGDPTPDQRTGAGTVVEGPDGERIKVVVPGK